MGHTACGAIKCAINGVQLGSLTGLLDKIKPAISATKYTGERTSNNDEFVDAVAQTNVLQTVNEIRKGSEILSFLEQKIVGAMYHLKGGKVEFEGHAI
jgi:carbonic anhydrase